MLEILNRLLEPIRNKIILMIAKALVTNSNDATGIQLVQVDLGNGEKIDSVERIQNFGFTGNPPDNSEALLLFLGGNREHPVCIAVDSSDKRIGVNKGDVVVYNSNGSKVFLNGTTIKIEANGIDIGTTVKKLVNETFQTLYNSHTHGGVTTGPSATSTPLPQMTSVNLTTKVRAE